MRQAAQQVVSGEVSPPIVDGLEPVGVHQQQRQRLAAQPRLLAQLGEPLVEPAAVEQPREAVAVRHPPQVLVEPGALHRYGGQVGQGLQVVQLGGPHGALVEGVVHRQHPDGVIFEQQWRQGEALQGQRRLVCGQRHRGLLAPQGLARFEHLPEKRRQRGRRPGAGRAAGLGGAGRAAGVSGAGRAAGVSGVGRPRLPSCGGIDGGAGGGTGQRQGQAHPRKLPGQARGLWVAREGVVAVHHALEIEALGLHGLPDPVRRLDAVGADGELASQVALALVREPQEGAVEPQAAAGGGPRKDHVQDAGQLHGGEQRPRQGEDEVRGAAQPAAVPAAWIERRLLAGSGALDHDRDAGSGSEESRVRRRSPMRMAHCPPS